MSDEKRKDYCYTQWTRYAPEWAKTGYHQKPRFTVNISTLARIDSMPSTK
jgi:hypothetical protein